ncbi:hypothetical protein [Glutamicibacter sp. JC586]|uniref:hypothetical protein n=1 Tax=Glutamicibacter sp. JC586 TaxID=2590552 RepID=UPI001358995F|nr:hypothetical protein [Glutamicibacter sp. JC586]
MARQTVDRLMVNSSFISAMVCLAFAAVVESLSGHISILSDWVRYFTVWMIFAQVGI